MKYCILIIIIILIFSCHNKKENNNENISLHAFLIDSIDTNCGNQRQILYKICLELENNSNSKIAFWVMSSDLFANIKIKNDSNGYIDINTPLHRLDSFIMHNYPKILYLTPYV